MRSQAARLLPGANGAELVFTALRVAVSALLLWGALTKLNDAGRIDALAVIWSAAGVPQPHLLVVASLALQLALALLLLVGLYARLAGVLVAMTFAAGAAVSGIFASGNWWAFALLIALLLQFGLLGGGRLSLDGWRGRRLTARMQAEQGSLEELLLSMGLQPASKDDNNPAGMGGEKGC